MSIIYAWVLRGEGSLQHASSTFCRMRFQFWIGKFLIKMQCISVRHVFTLVIEINLGLAQLALHFRICKQRVATKLNPGSFKKPRFISLDVYVWVFLLQLFQAFYCYTGDGEVIRTKLCPNIGNEHFSDICFKKYGKILFDTIENWWSTWKYKLIMKALEIATQREVLDPKSQNFQTLLKLIDA